MAGTLAGTGGAGGGTSLASDSTNTAAEDGAAGASSASAGGSGGNTGAIVGGGGGGGGTSGAFGGGTAGSANGGAGGTGLSLSGTSGNYSNAAAGTIVGGGGGGGGASMSSLVTNNVANGGVGGAGVSWTGSVQTLNNAGTVAGGGGGGGGLSQDGGTASSTASASGGDGGAGMKVSGSNDILVNSGVIIGGNGGGAGFGGSSTVTGAGGAGVIGAGLTVINGGTIAGGMSGDGHTQADAITFTSGTNSLMLNSGSVLNGAVDVATGATATITAGALGLNVTGGSSGSRALIVNGATTINTNGNALTISGSISGSGALTATGNNTGGDHLMLGTVGVGSLTDSVATTLNGNVTTGGGQTYNSAVTLGADVAASDTNGGNIAFNSAVDGAHNLTAPTMGAVSFAGALGASTALNSVTTTSGTFSAGSTINVTGSLSITTTGGSIGQSASWIVGGATTLNAGSNAITLSNAGNVFIGAVNLAGGNAQLTSGGALTLGSVNTGALTATSGGSLNLGTGVVGGALNATSQGDISQTGALSISGSSALNAGSGAVILTNAGNMFGGAVSASGSWVSLASSGNLNVAALTSSNHGNVSLTAGGALTLPASGITTGTGDLALSAGSGLLSADGNLSGGAVSLSSGAGMALSGNVSGSSVNLSSSSGTMVLTGVLASTSGTTINAGTLQVGNGGTSGAITGNVVNKGTLAFNRSDNITFGGTISGNGALVQSGTGTLTLTGANTYTGDTTVKSGTLEVGDQGHPTARVAGNVLVDPNGTLRGHGTVGASVTNYGAVWPGGSIGVLSVAGDYAQAPSGKLMIDVSPTAASQLTVGGTASLAGTLSLLYGPGTYRTTTYRIINAGAVNGGFATVTGNTPQGFTQSVAMGAGAVELALIAANPMVVAPSNATVFGALGSAVVREGQRINGVLLDRLGGACADAPAWPIQCARPGEQGWAQATGNITRVDGNHDAPGYDDRRYGFLAGLDHPLGDWTLGVAAGYSHGDVSEDGTGSRGSLDTLRVAGYGGRALGPVNLAGTLGYAYDFLSSKRSFAGLGNAEGSAHGQELHAGVQAAVPLPAGALVVTPRAGVRYQYFHGQTFSETGPTSQSLTVGAQNLRSLQPYVGLTVGYPLLMQAERPALIEARLGYAYETLGTGREVAVTSADGTGFVIPGATSSRGMLSAGLSLALPLRKSLDLQASYDTLIRTGNVSAQTFKLGLNYRF
ncbi:autotransporter outer membrane beta-barrel domain-containing protein [Cupriavidus basilensis]|nr:autotransporter outer membrane beta-barrel domain-containing protein [Cupriavidus basilensis]